jgi:dynein heavy chain
MALQERHRWMAANVAACFGIVDKTLTVEEALGEWNNIKKVNDFLDGKSKHKHLFVYYQNPDIVDDNGELVDSKSAPKLWITTGEHEDMRLKNRAAYFLRNVPDQKAIRVDVSSDGDLLFGEMGKSPLKSLNSGLAGVFKPMICRMGSTVIDWAACETEQAGEFKVALDKFTQELANGIKSLSCGIDLAVPEPLENPSATYAELVRQKPDIVRQYEEILEQWCQEIEKYLEDASEGKQDTGDLGPRTELEWWRTRLQMITSITEQLKTKERKIVFGLLQAVTRQAGDIVPKSRQTVFDLLRRWKQVDISITEAFNEAKDNVKYLTTLEKFIEPLYVSTPAAIIDTLPALMNAAKMIHTIARYYNTTERMTNLFTKTRGSR